MQEKSRKFRQGRSLSTSSAQCAHWAPSPPRGRLWGQANNHYYTIILKQSRVSAALSRMWLGFYLRLFFTMNTATAATPTRLTTIMPIHRPMLALSPVLGADQGLVL